MSRKPYSLSKQLVVAAALVLGTTGVALADDNSMDPHNGDSYAYFNGGNLPQSGRPVIDKTPSTFHVTNPHGLSASDYQALASDGRAWPLPNPSDATAIAAMDVGKSFHQANPHGLSFDQYQVLSSADPAWRSTQIGTGARAATSTATVANSTDDEPARTGIARLFDLFHGSRPTSAN